MIAASGVRFDGLDLLSLIFFLACLYLLAYWWVTTYWRYQQEPVIKTTGRKLTMAETDQVFREVFIPRLDAALAATNSMFGILTEQQVYGDFSETPMRFYDWANERPMPVVNW